jgi:hypothetical protein
VRAETRMADYTRRLLEQVTWDWQQLDPMITEAMKVVPPGKAIRRYQSNKAGNKPPSGEGPPKAPLSEAEQIVSGQRSIVNDALGTLKSGGYVEVDPGPRLVRRKSQVAEDVICDHCGRAPQTEPIMMDRAVVVPMPNERIESLEHEVAKIRTELNGLRRAFNTHAVANQSLPYARGGND